MTADCYLSNFADLRKRAGRVQKHGGGSGYWAGEALRVLDRCNELGVTVADLDADRSSPDPR